VNLIIHEIFSNRSDARLKKSVSIDRNISPSILLTDLLFCQIEVFSLQLGQQTRDQKICGMFALDFATMYAVSNHRPVFLKYIKKKMFPF
jgi:hypothetical protein